jgi:hypothetical protein
MLTVCQNVVNLFNFYFDLYSLTASRDTFADMRLQCNTGYKTNLDAGELRQPVFPAGFWFDTVLGIM